MGEGEDGGEQLNSYPPHLSPLPPGERIHPVKYVLFDVTHLELMQQDAGHGYLSILI